MEPGLVALYVMWPGNGAGLFLQLRSPHRPEDSLTVLQSETHGIMFDGQFGNN